jgi:hypothetical protein
MMLTVCSPLKGYHRFVPLIVSIFPLEVTQPFEIRVFRC